MLVLVVVIEKIVVVVVVVVMKIRSSNLPGKTCSISKPGSCVLAV